MKEDFKEGKSPEKSQGQGREWTPLTEMQEKGRNPVLEVGFKTAVPSVFLIAFGLMMLFLQSVLAKIGGAVFAGIGLFGLLGVKDHVTAKLYETSITLIDHNTNMGINILYSDIVEWNIDNGIILKTKDGGRYAVESYSCGKALKVLRQYIPDRETKQLLSRRRKQEKMKSPLDLFK